jgi:hypothetical protein
MGHVSLSSTLLLSAIVDQDDPPTPTTMRPSDQSVELTLGRVQAALCKMFVIPRPPPLREHLLTVISREQKLRPDLESIKNGIRYGTTQAFVFGAFESLSGGKVYHLINPDIHCVDVEERPRMETIRQSLEEKDYLCEKRATCEPAHIALKAYSGYKKLYGERRYAWNYSAETASAGNVRDVEGKFAEFRLLKPSTTPTVNFMDLPGEIRNRVYKLLLIVEPEIDLAPRSWDRT